MAAMAEASGPPTPHESETMKEDCSPFQIVSLSSPIQGKSHNQYDHRFQRSDLWLPVYSWLESLSADEVVKSNDVLDWLKANPETSEQLSSRHSRYHLMHYIKKCHMKILKRKEMKGVQLLTASKNKVSAVEDHNDEEAKSPVSVQQIGNNSSSLPKDYDLYRAKHKEALEKYGLLVEFEKHLLNMISKRDT